jgi:integrase
MNSNKKTNPSAAIKLRTRQLSNGKKSLYLAYSKDGVWQYEFFGKEYYLIPEKTPADKLHNTEIMRLATAIRDKKAVELAEQTAAHFNLNIKKYERVNLVEYVRKTAETALNDTGNRRGDYHNFCSLANHLEKYRGDKITLKDIDEAYITGFIDYLKHAKNSNYKDRELEKNGQHKLFSKFKRVLKNAVRDKIISTNPIDLIDDSKKPKTEQSKRVYLTEAELKSLYLTPCKYDDIKRAFLFCCLVGLRFGNVRRLVWGDLYDDEGMTKFDYRQVKTGKQETLYISDEAKQFLPERTTEMKDDDRIFNLPKNDTTNKQLKKWYVAAGIKKTVTFHCSRHTAATLSLTLGVPIEIVSKQLGHSRISTTQIYGKIIDRKKKEAVQLQNGLFERLTG